jgi:hypothetical protein
LIVHTGYKKMKSPLDRLRVKQKILRVFKPGCDAVIAAQALSDDELEAMLDVIRPSIPFRKPTQNQALEMFLFAGVHRFDRWFPPTPFVVPPTHTARFAKFVSELKRVEEREPTNCPVFQLHLIRDELFRRFDGVPVCEISREDVKQLQELVQQVVAPANPIKRGEFEEQKTASLAILEGLADESLRTVISFRIPYVMHKQQLDLGLKWWGIRMQVLVVPQFNPINETFTVFEGGAALSVGASRWQTGTSQITIRMAALLDGSAYTERLQALPGHENPVDGWPKSFSWAFSIFHDLFWNLREKHGGHQDWIPAPRDLSDLEFSIQTSSCEGLGYIRKGSPAALLEFFGVSLDVLLIELGDIQPLAWSVECQTRATMYLELGETNEALFWLNVAVESLIAQRFNEIEQATEISGLAVELGSPKEFWAQSEEIVRKQYPEMAGKIKWPTAPIHASVFSKMKTLYRRVKMKTTIDELLCRYRDISGERNDLVHGRRTSRVSVAAVMTACEALAWINENMWPQMPTAGA